MAAQRYLGTLTGFPIHRIPSASSELVSPMGKVGVEVELEGWDGFFPPAHQWVAHTEEGSIRNNGIEFVTSGEGVIGQDIVDRVRSFCALAREHQWSEGVPRAAIHVHLDVTDLDFGAGELTRLVTNYILVEHLFFGFAGDWRKDCGFCVPYDMGQEDFNILKLILALKCSDKDLPRTLGRLSEYQALNLNPIQRFGTVEFRHLPTTFGSERILNWINLIFALKESVQHPELAQPLKLLSSKGAEYVASLILGKMWPLVAPHLDSRAMWAGCDIVSYLLLNLGEEVPITSWNEVAKRGHLQDSPVIEAKLQMMKTSREQKLMKERT